MSQVSPGDDGTRQKPGPEARKGSPAKRPPAKAAPKGRQPAGAAKAGAAKTSGAKTGAPKGRPPTGGKGRPPTSGGAKGRAPRPNMQITAPPPRRFSPSTLAFVSIGLVVVIVLVFVVVKVTGGSNSAAPKNGLLPPPATASATVVSDVTGVSQTVADTVGIGSGVTAPQVVKGQPKLTADGKPEVLFIGAEFCPYCAAERWSLVLALSRFGTLSGLTETTSSPWDAYPATATFSFRNVVFTSQYLSLVSVEHETNDNSGSGTRKLFQPLTTAQSNLWSKYSQQFGQQTGYPFVDFNNKIFVLGPSYVPDVLAGLNQQEIANKLSNPNDVVTQRIVGTANYLTASICAITGNQPTAVCSASGTHKAAVSMKLS